MADTYTIRTTFDGATPLHQIHVMGRPAGQQYAGNDVLPALQARVDMLNDAVELGRTREREERSKS
jgi:hypothetical protein